MKLLVKMIMLNLRDVGSGSEFKCALIYHIKHAELYVVKKPIGNDVDIPKLTEREALNYSKLKHPLLPKFIGRVKENNCIVIEFINGKTFDNVDRMNLTYIEKMSIISELIFIFKYFHDNNLIYRDLKPNNVMIDENKSIVLIDLDRLIEYDSDSEKTKDLASAFSAPEVYIYGMHSPESDIYSLGEMVKWIIGETNEFSEIWDIIQKCTTEDVKKRPSIKSIIKKISLELQSKINIENSFEKHEKYFEIINLIAEHYEADLNHPLVQFNLGVIYYKGVYVKKDVTVVFLIW